jgi:hypothetical protein
MASGHNNIKRILYRILEEINSTRKIAKETSWSDAIATFKAKIDIQLMNRNGYYESPQIKLNLLKKHEVMNKYFQKNFTDFIHSYNFDFSNMENSSNYKNCIWVCWWQGIDNAPEVVKKCIESIRKNANGYEVIIITEENYRSFAKIPAWLQKKKSEGIISRTHYSDFLRLELLAEHGGIWLDSTFYCTNLNFEDYFNMPVWTIKRPNYGHASVACGNFANYSFGCDFEHRWVFTIIKDYLAEYWKNNDSIIDYLFLDYLIVLVQKYNSRVAKIFSNIPSNNPQCDDLIKILAAPYDEAQWLAMKEDTRLFKLTWKHTFPKEKDGKKTFYGKLIDGTL